MKNTRTMPILAAAMMLLTATLTTQASSGTWNGSLDSEWAKTNNWGSANPVPGSGQTATFNNAGNGNTTLNLGAGVTIQSILFDTLNAAGYTLGSGGVGSQTLTLNDNGAITLYGTVANNQRLDANLLLGTATAASYALTNNSSTATLTAAGTIQGGAGGVGGAKTLTVAGTGNTTLSGVIANGGASSMSVSKTGSGLLILSGPNTYSGNTTVGGGIVRADYGIGIPASGGVLYLTGGGVLETTGTIARTVGTAANNIAFSGSGGFAARGAPLFVTLNSGGTLTWGSGSFPPANSSLVLGSPSADNVVTMTNNLDSTANGWWPGLYVIHNSSLANTLVDKAVLAGSLNWTGGNNNNTYWQKYGNGRLEITGAPGTQSGNSGVMVANGVLALLGPAALAGYRGVWVGGGDFEIAGSSTNNTAKTINILGISNGSDLLNTPAIAYGGPGTVTLIPGSGYGLKLTAASASRSAGGTVLFRGTDLGTATNPTANVANLFVTDQTGLSLTGATNTGTSIKIIPYAIGDNSATGNGTDFVTYHVTNGVRLLTAGEYDTAIADGQTATNNVSLTTEQTVNSATFLNALRLAGGGGVVGSGTLTLNSGAILTLAGNGGLNVGTMAFGTKEAILTTLGDLTIGSALTGSGGLTKSGSGKLTLTRANGFGISGTLTVNSGTLAAQNTNAIAGPLKIQPGAMTDMSGFDQALTALTGSTLGTFTNSGATATLTLNTPADTTLALALNGGINVIKTGTAALITPLVLITSPGSLSITQGTFQINFSTAIPSITAPLATSGRAISLDNGATLTYYNTGTPGNNNPYQTFIGDTVTIGAGGATLKFDTVALQNCVAGARIANLALNGPVTLTNNTTSVGANSSWAFSNIIFTGTQAITNNSPAVNQAAATLPATNNSPAGTLVLSSATGAGFNLGTTSTSLNLSNLVCNSVLTLWDSGATGATPLNGLKANGGRLVMGPGATLIFLGRGSSLGQVIDPDQISWQGSGTLTMPIVSGGNGDSFWRVTSNLEVSATSGLTRLNSTPKRGYLTVDSPYALIIGNGGTYSLNITSGQFNEYLMGNLKLFNGSIVLGSGTAVGGMIRGSGTLTLGDGTGTPSSPSVVTVQGNHGSGSNTFNLGYATNMVENGTTRMKYANTSAGSTFNVGWSAGLAYNSALLPFKETSGGTEFAPLAGAGGLAVVGPSTGFAAAFTNAVVLSTAGTVGFYNRDGNNYRNTLGAMAVTNGGRFLVTTNGGTARATSITVSGGTIGGAGSIIATNLSLLNNAIYQVWLTGSASNQCGYLEASNALVFASGTSLTVIPTNGFTPSANQYWMIARSPSISAAPAAPMGYSVEIQGNYLKLTKLPTDGFQPYIANANPGSVQDTAAVLNGNLMSTGQAPATVSVFWGPADGGANLSTSTWANTNTFPTTMAEGPLATNITSLADNTYYYYRFYATNTYGEYMADPAQSFITGDIDIQALANAAETGPVTGLFSVARAATLTNEDLTVNYSATGTAAAGLDYATLSGSVVIPRGQTNATIAVAPFKDALVEGDETVTLTLLPGSYVVGTASSATVTIVDYAAKTLTWTDGSASHRWNSTDVNWTDGSAQAFTDGDNVLFTDSAANRYIGIAGTVKPFYVTFQNSASYPYQFTNGTLGGAAALTVSAGGTVKLGTDGFETTTPAAPVLSYSGGTVISNNSLVKYSCGSSTPTNALGSGPVTLDNGRLNLNFSGSANGGSMWFMNTMAVSPLGGILDLAPDGGNNNRRPYWIFPGGFNLAGMLRVDGNGVNQGLINPPTFGTVTLAGDQMITNGTINGETRINLTRLSGASRTLTLAGAPFGLTEYGSALNVSNINSLTHLGIMDNNTGVNDTDYLSQFRANGGKIGMASGKTLTLARGAWMPSDFLFGSNVVISLMLSGQSGTAKFMDNMTIGTNDNQASQIYWYLGQNEVLAAASGKTLTIGAGGLLNLYSAGMPAAMDGNLRFADGSRFNLTWTPNNNFNRNSGTLFLGDGNSVTTETVRITGLMVGDNSLNVFNIAYPSNVVSDDSNVVVRYESNAGNAASSFNMSWSFQEFRGGSAGTVFAPYEGGGGFRAVGPASGTVFTLSQTGTVATAGLVGFYNASGSSVGMQGPLIVTNSGTLAFLAKGTVQAGDVTFRPGTTLAAMLTGDATNDCSLVNASDTLRFDDTTTIIISETAAGKGPWYVAQGATLVGLPRKTVGPFVVTAENNKVRVDRKPTGTLIMIN